MVVLKLTWKIKRVAYAKKKEKVINFVLDVIVKRTHTKTNEQRNSRINPAFNLTTIPPSYTKSNTYVLIYLIFKIF